MTKTVLRRKVIDYINHAEENVLEVVYKMLQMYERGDGKSLMTPEQKSEIDRRSALFRSGKLKVTNWEIVKRKVGKTK